MSSRPRERFDEILERFDDQYVSFSGGKDSLACLHLFKEAWDRAQREGPIKVLFYDEELIPDAVVNFVDEYRTGLHKDVLVLLSAGVKQVLPRARGQLHPGGPGPSPRSRDAALGDPAGLVRRGLSVST